MLGFNLPRRQGLKPGLGAIAGRRPSAAAGFDAVWSKSMDVPRFLRGIEGLAAGLTGPSG